MAQQGMELMDEPATADAEKAAPRSSATPPTATADANPRGPERARNTPGGWRNVANNICVPLAAGVALAAHYAMPDRGPQIQSGAYPALFVAALILGLASIGVRRISRAAESWVSSVSPLLAAGIFWVCGWELMTAKLMLLPSM